MIPFNGSLSIGMLTDFDCLTQMMDIMMSITWVCQSMRNRLGVGEKKTCLSSHCVHLAPMHLVFSKPHNKFHQRSSQYGTCEEISCQNQHCSAQSATNSFGAGRKRERERETHSLCNGSFAMGVLQHLHCGRAGICHLSFICPVCTHFWPSSSNLLLLQLFLTILLIHDDNDDPIHENQNFSKDTSQAHQHTLNVCHISVFIGGGRERGEGVGVEWEWVTVCCVVS